MATMYKLRDAFNAVVAGTASCESATLDHGHSHDAPVQNLSFYGTWNSGEPFMAEAHGIRPDADLVEASRQAARTLLEQQKP